MKEHISVCICTFRRNNSLEHLLRRLKQQITGGLFYYSIIVVDNDENGSAREIVLHLRSELCLDINYDIEPERSIPAARNRALTMAIGNYICIIDDDEFPPPQWLVTLYRAIHTFNVDGALGPVHPFFSQEPPTWLLKGRFCERPVHRTGTLLRWSQTRTGNALIKKSVFDENQLNFDLTLKTSGSDCAFFKEAMRFGYRFVAVEEAPVYEFVMPERWTMRYYIRRALVQGFNAHRNSASEYRSIVPLAVFFKSFTALLTYAILLPFSACLGKHMLLKCLEKGSHHLSRLFAMLSIELVKKRDF